MWTRLSRSTLEPVENFITPLSPVGWVEPRWRSLSERDNPTIPALTERAVKIIGHLFASPMLTILNIQSIFDRHRIGNFRVEESMLVMLGYLVPSN